MQLGEESWLQHYMDRRNGGDPLAPPRPPKLLPRVHRPRAPEPTLSGVDHNAGATASALASGASSAAPVAIHNNNSQQQLSISAAASNNNTISIIPASPDFDDYQIHHLTFLPQRPSSLSRNSSTASSTTATGISVSGSGSVSGSSSSFTRRRPPAPVPLNNSISNNNNNSINNNFLSHFQSAEPASNALGQPPASPSRWRNRDPNPKG